MLTPDLPNRIVDSQEKLSAKESQLATEVPPLRSGNRFSRCPQRDALPASLPCAHIMSTEPVTPHQHQSRLYEEGGAR
jgi:hypothetical protein